jgi:hypothetical protein
MIWVTTQKILGQGQNPLILNTLKKKWIFSWLFLDFVQLREKTCTLHNTDGPTFWNFLQKVRHFFLRGNESISLFYGFHQSYIFSLYHRAGSIIPTLQINKFNIKKISSLRGNSTKKSQSDTSTLLTQPQGSVNGAGVLAIPPISLQPWPSQPLACSYLWALCLTYLHDWFNHH